MTNDERFERDLAAAVRDGAPIGAPPSLRRRLAGSLAAPQPTLGARLGVPALAAAAAIAVLVAVAVIGPRFIAEPGQSPPASMGSTVTVSPGASDAPTSASPPTAPPLAEPVTSPGFVQGGQRLTLNEGWVMNVEGRLFMTRSAGTAWRDITPPGGSSETRTAGFLDFEHGWLIEQPEEQLEGAESLLVIWRTADAGVTWSRSEIPGVRLGNMAFDLLTPSVGWLATDPGGQAPLPELRWTLDGGATWSAPIDLTSRLLNGASVHDLTFLDERVGFMGGDQQLRRTTDGGLTWTSIAFLPDQPRARYGLPEFVNRLQAVLRVSILDDDEQVVEQRIYTSDNVASNEDGGNWRLAVKDELLRLWAFVDADFWVAADGQRIWNTGDGGRLFAVQPSTGLPLRLEFALITFVDRLHGWATALGNPCGPGTYGCLRGPGVFATSDGGRTWARIGDCEADSPLFPCSPLGPEIHVVPVATEGR